MNNQVFFYAGFLLFGVLISAISQVMLKKAALRHYESRIKEYLNPLVIIAYSIFVVSTLCSILAYRGIPLSMGPVLESTSYIYVTIFGVKIFHEKLDAKRVAALCFIIGGIIVYSVFG
jgi:multidrug transporter EmrE-like cation transporter